MPDELTEILKNAVQIEEESFNLYTIAQQKARLESSKSFFKELAETELEHKKKLLDVIKGKTRIQSLGKQRGESSEDLRIVDYMRDVKELPENADYQEILTYAAQREKRTYDYYLCLAKKFQGTQIGEMFNRLGDEELKHKIRIEKEYDDSLLKGN